MPKLIPLSKGFSAIVDDEDYEIVSQHKWCAHVNRNTVYARRSEAASPNRQRTVQLHRFLMKPESSSVLVDHKDGNGLNCVRSNMRLATCSQNCRNQRVRKNNTSGYKGVSWFKSMNQWRADIWVGTKLKHLGRFDDILEAAAAYKAFAEKLHGEFFNPKPA